MDFLEYIKTTLHIDPIVVLIVLASGFFQDRYLCKWNICEDSKTASAVRTLLVSFLVSVTYLYLVGTPRNLFAYYFLSFFLATSFYELAVRPLTQWVQKTFGTTEEKKTSNEEKTL